MLPLDHEQAPLKLDEGGVCRVSGTRVTLESLLASYHQGASPEEIADRYPSVPLADIYTTIGYCLRHAEEVAAYLKTVEAEEAAIAAQILSRHPVVDYRDRLLSRQKPVAS